MYKNIVLFLQNSDNQNNNLMLGNCTGKPSDFS